MPDRRDNPTQGDAHGLFRLSRRLFDGMQILAPRPQIAPAAEIWAEETFRIDHTRGRTFLQDRQGQPPKLLWSRQGGAGRLIDLQEIPEIAEPI
jgi:hypothetical protein